MTEKLRTAVVIDYQNIHLTAHDVFAAPGEERHETLIHPLRFASALLAERNGRQRPGYAQAELHRVLMYRGQPSSEHDPQQFGRTEAQRAAWASSDPRVQVHYRPLRYTLRPGGSYSTSSGQAPPTIIRVQEKGIDVLCALAVVEQARTEEIDLVILASHDTDLEPSLDAALDLGTARVETCQWWNAPIRRTKQLRPTAPRQVWNTRPAGDRVAFEDRLPRQRAAGAVERRSGVGRRGRARRPGWRRRARRVRCWSVSVLVLVGGKCRRDQGSKRTPGAYAGSGAEAEIHHRQAGAKRQA